MKGRKVPEVNASSMADIAFLLLSFFLVATNMDSTEGIVRTLPSAKANASNQPVQVNERNAMSIAVDQAGRILINNQEVGFKDNAIKNRVIAFVDNNKNGLCNYCQGSRSAVLSDSPKEAVVSLEFNAKTKAKHYVAVLDQVDGAYNFLRNRYSESKFKQSYENLGAKDKDIVDNAYPKNLAEGKPVVKESL